MLTDWEFSGIAVIQSGIPLSVFDYNAGSVYGLLGGEVRAQRASGDPETHGSMFSRVTNSYLNPGAFTRAPEAPNGTSLADQDFGDSGVGFIRGPGQHNLDMAVERVFPVREASSFRFRAEFFNLTNTPQFGNPNTILGYTDPTLLESVSQPHLRQNYRNREQPTHYSIRSEVCVLREGRGRGLRQKPDPENLYPWRRKMLSIEDLESACNASQRIETPRHLVEPPELPFHATFYPYGFPAVITTNSGGVLKQYEELWGKFTKQHDTEPIRTEVQVVESNATECPPEPTYRYMQPLLMCVADADNYSMSIWNLARRRS